MKGTELLDKMALIDDVFVEEADNRKYAKDSRRVPHSKRRWIVVLSAAVLALFLMGAGVIVRIYGDLWIETPSNDPAESVRSAIENQIGKDYAIHIEVERIEVDTEETQRVVGNMISGVIADRRGWSDEYLGEHFVVVKATYYAEYDPSLTTRNDGNVVQYFYLTRNPNSGKWNIVDNSGNVNWSENRFDKEPAPILSREDQLFDYLSNLFTGIYSQYYDGLHYEIEYKKAVVNENEWTAEFFWTMYHLGKGWDIESDEGVEMSMNISLQATVKLKDNGALDFNTIVIFADSSPTGPAVYDIPLESLFPDQLSNE